MQVRLFSFCMSITSYVNSLACLWDIWQSGPKTCTQSRHFFFFYCIRDAGGRLVNYGSLQSAKITVNCCHLCRVWPPQEIFRHKKATLLAWLFSCLFQLNHIPLFYESYKEACTYFWRFLKMHVSIRHNQKQNINHYSVIIIFLIPYQFQNWWFIKILPNVNILAF